MNRQRRTYYVTPAMRDFLRVLRDTFHGTAPSRIALTRAAGRSDSNGNVLIGRLEKRDLVRTVIGPGKAQRVELTERGYATLL